MNEYQIEETGVVAVLNNQYWGIQYQDSHSTSYDFGPIENAKISDPDYCTKPTDLTYQGSPHFKKLAKAKLVKVVKTITYKVDI